MSDPADTLQLELRRLDRLLHRQILRLRATYEASHDELRGLYISDEQVDRMVAGHPRMQRPTVGPNLAEEAAELDGSLQATGSLLRELATRFDLTPFERDCLLLATAPELDLRYETIIAYLNNDVTRKWPTVDLALRLFSDASGWRPVQREMLGHSGALHRTGLLRPVVSERPVGSLACGFRAAPVVVQHLLGMRLCDPQLGQIVGSFEIAGSDGDLVLSGSTADRLARIAALLERRPTRPMLLFRGHPGSGRRAGARRLCQLLGRDLLVAELAPLWQVEPPERQRLIRRIALQARLQGAGVYVHDEQAASGPGEPTALGPLLELLRESWPVMVGVAPDRDCRTLLRRPILTVSFADPDDSERVALWQTALATNGIRPQVATLTEVAHRFVMTPGQIAAASARAAIAHDLEGPDDGEPTVQLLMEAAKDQLDQSLGKLAVKVPCAHRFCDLVLPASTMARVREILAAIRHRARVYGDWGFGRHMRNPHGLTVLFAGASGTGKTMTAGVLAAEVGLDLYRIDLAGVVSKYIGETEKNLDRIFSAARRAGALLFFDEADALFGKRSQVKDAHDRYANIEVAYLLQKLEEHPGVVVLATNMGKNIDSAFSRRMQHVVDFPRPDEGSRERLWRGIFPAATPLHEDVDLAFLAHNFEVTGGDIRTVALDAAFSAAAGARALTMLDLIRAMARHQRKQGRLPAVSDFKQYHALVAQGR